MSSLRAPWRNGPYKNLHTERQKNTYNTMTQQTFRKKLDFCVFRHSNLTFLFKKTNKKTLTLFIIIHWQTKLYSTKNKCGIRLTEKSNVINSKLSDIWRFVSLNIYTNWSLLFCCYLDIYTTNFVEMFSVLYRRMFIPKSVKISQFTFT